MIEELDTVVLNQNMPDHGLKEGDVGAVVHVYEGGRAFEVEFVTAAGQTLSVVTVEPEKIRPMAATEILHVRALDSTEAATA